MNGDSHREPLVVAPSGFELDPLLLEIDEIDQITLDHQDNLFFSASTSAGSATSATLPYPLAESMLEPESGDELQETGVSPSLHNPFVQTFPFDEDDRLDDITTHVGAVHFDDPVFPLSPRKVHQAPITATSPVKVKPKAKERKVGVRVDDGRRGGAAPRSTKPAAVKSYDVTLTKFNINEVFAERIYRKGVILSKPTVAGSSILSSLVVSKNAANNDLAMYRFPSIPAIGKGFERNNFTLVGVKATSLDRVHLASSTVALLFGAAGIHVAALHNNTAYVVQHRVDIGVRDVLSIPPHPALPTTPATSLVAVANERLEVMLLAVDSGVAEAARQRQEYAVLNQHDALQRQHDVLEVRQLWSLLAAGASMIDNIASLALYPCCSVLSVLLSGGALYAIDLLTHRIAFVYHLSACVLSHVLYAHPLLCCTVAIYATDDGNITMTRTDNFQIVSQFRSGEGALVGEMQLNGNLLLVSGTKSVSVFDVSGMVPVRTGAVTSDSGATVLLAEWANRHSIVASTSNGHMHVFELP